MDNFGEKAKLTDKDKMLCQRYAIHFNKTQAAIEAGFTARSACPMAIKTLRKPEVKAYLASLINESLNATKEVLEKQIIDKCVAIISANVTDYINSDGTQTDWTDLDQRPIKSIKAKLNAKGDERIEVELHDPKPYIDLLSKYIDLAGAKEDTTIVINNISETEKLTDDQLRKIVSNSQD